MFCTQCGKEIREGSKFCTNCGAAVKIEPKPTVTEAPVINAPIKNAEIYDKMNPSMQGGKNKMNVGLIVIIIVILCGSFWFLGGRDIILDVVENFESKIIDKIGNLHISNVEKTEDDIDYAEGIEDSGSDLEIAEEEAVEYGDTEVKEVIQPDEFTEEEEGIEEEEEIEEPEEIEESSEYIIENSDTRYLTKDDLIGMTAEECRLARNELYARHGRKFDDEGLQSYFEACSWYHGSIEPKDFQESMLSDIEIANRDLIVEYEKEMGYR